MKPKFVSRIALSRIVFVATSLGMSAASQATQIAWSGASGTDATAWADGANWAGTAPANDLTTDKALFALANYTGKQPNAGTRSVTGIQIGTGAATGALTISGTALSLGASGIDMKALAAATTISAPVTLGAAQTWASASANDLNISGAIGGTADLTRSGTGIVRFTGAGSNAFVGALKINTLGGTGNIANTTTYFNKTGGAVAVPANTVLTFGTTTTGQGNLEMSASNQFGSGVELKFQNANGNWARFDMRGTNQTLAGVNAGVVTGTNQMGAVIQNRQFGNNTAGSFGPATLTLDGSADFVYYGYFRNVDGGTAGTDTLALVKSGSGKQTLVGNAISYSGATTVSGGTLEFAKTTGLNTSISNSSIVIINSIAADDWILNNSLVLSGNGTWRKVGPGRASFNSATLTTTGKFEIKEGTLRNNNNSGNWSSSTADMDISTGAILDLYADAVYVNKLTGTGFVQNGFGNPTGQSGASALFEKLVVGVADGTSTFNGVIRDNATGTTPTNGSAGGGLQLDKAGSGILTLTGANTYTGLTNILGGKLVLSGGNAIADTASVVPADALDVLLQLDADETIGALSGGGATGGNVDLQSHTLTLAGTANTSFGGVLSGGGGMIKTGTGEQTLSAANTYFGATAINAGKLTLSGSLTNSNLSIADAATAGGEGSAPTITLGSASGCELAVDPTTPGALSAIGGLTVNGVTLVSLSGPVTTPNFKVIGFGSNLNGFTNTNFSLADSAAYRSASFAVNANDVSVTVTTKSLEWTGANDNLWDLNFTENFVTMGSSIPQKFFAADDVLFGDLPVTDQTIAVFQPVAPSSMTVNSALNYTFSGSPITSSTLLKDGSGRLTLLSANSFSGGTVINDGILQVGNNVTDPSLGSGSYTIANGKTLRIEYATTDAALTNLGSMAWGNFSGAGVLNIAANGVGDYIVTDAALPAGFTGTLKIDGGRVSTPPSGGLGGTTKVIVNPGGHFGMWNGGTTFGPDVSFEIAGTGYGEVGFEGAIRMSNGGGTNTINGNVSLTGNATIGASGTGIVNGVISGGFDLTFGTVSMNGIMELGGANTHSGLTSINYGTLRLANPNALQNSTLSGSAGAVEFASTITDFTLGGLEGSRNLALQDTTAVAINLKIGNNDAPTIHTGVISGPGNLVKIGSGMLSLNGSNTYTGNTTVEKGVLSVSSGYFADSSTVSIAAGAQLVLNTSAALDKVAKLVLNNVTMAAGTYNSTTPIYGAYFSGDGSLVVGSAYDTWTNSKGLAGADALASADPDHDGISNALEFVIRGEPNPANPNSNSNGLLPTVTEDNNYLNFTYHRTDEANAMTGIFIGVEYGSDLTGWTVASNGFNGVIVAETNDGFGTGVDMVVVSIPRSLAVDSKLFAHLKVILP